MLPGAADERQTAAANRLVERDEVRLLLSRLTDRERTVVSGHFGLEEEAEPASYEQMGRRLGLSKERVRQIEQAALAKLRAAAESQVL
jgi:RNA polymerase nonessential primary-like sigma factor